MPIGNITQTISELPPAGSRGVDVQSIFVIKQEDFQDHLQGTTVTELNTLKGQLNSRIGEINSTTTTMNGYATSASSSASTATTKANEASTSASQALTSRNQAETFKNQALTYAQQAEASAESIDVNTLVHIKSTNITVNVGVGQTYTTINQALEYLSGFYPMYKKSGITATINLKAGFVMAEQVLVSGIDLGWITIVGEDAETIITHTALTTAFNGSYPAFGVDKGGTSPVIGQLFRFNVEKVGGSKHGLLAYGTGSSASVLNGKGFIGAGANGIFAGGASTINATGANCSNAGANGIFVGEASTINATGANCSNAGNIGIVADASTINATGANCSNAGIYGIVAQFASTINATGANCSNAGDAGIFAIDASTINATGANCSNAGANGIFAAGASIIHAYGAIIQNQTKGTFRISITNGSHIEAIGINTTGGTAAVFSQAVNTLTAQGIIYA